MAIKSLQHSSIRDNVFYRSMLVGNQAFGPSDEDVLDEIVLTSSAASVTFTGLDSYTDYKHLQLRAVGSSTDTNVFANINLQINSDTGANYSYHYLQALGTSLISTSGTSRTFTARADWGGQSTLNNAVPVVLDILDFANTNKNTTLRWLSGNNIANTGRMRFGSGAWYNTNAVTSLAMTADSGNFITGSRFTLIGLK